MHLNPTLPLLLLAGSGLSAQPTLQYSEMAPIGTVVNMRFMQTFSAVDATIQGPNALWDFTGLAPDLAGQPFVLEIVAPSTTPNGNLFPAANLAWRELPNNFYRYFNLSANKMERVGSYTTSARTYVDPQIEYVFPLTYNTTNTDTWETMTSDGTYSLTCVGYGTLMLPGNTFNDVLMVHVELTEQGIFSFDFFFWYSSVDGTILTQYSPGGILAESGLFIESMGIGIEEQEAPGMLLGTAPVDGQLMLRFNRDLERTEYSIFSSSGALVGSGKLTSARAGEVVTLDVNGLASGVYVLDLGAQGDYMAPLRFVVP